MLALRVGLEGMVNEEGSAHTEERGCGAEEIVHELSGVEEGDVRDREGRKVGFDSALAFKDLGTGICRRTEIGR